jgi:taurine dioxygenase
MADGQRLSVEPMNIGAKICGLDFSRPLDRVACELIYRTWLDAGLIVLHDVELDNTQLIALSRCFGDLEPPAMPELCVEGEPLLMELGRRVFGQGYVIDETELRLGRQGWHRDTGFTPTVCKGALLKMAEISPEQGETLFADTAKAFDALPEAMQRRIESLEVKVTLKSFLDTPFGKTWRTIRHATPEEYSGSSATFDRTTFERYPSVIQPMVITHPETGRKCIFLSPQYVDYIIGMPRDESDDLLNQIIDHMTSDEFRYMHVWRPGDIVAWDNRRCMHAALGYHPKYRRTGYRTTFAGPMVTGRYFDGRAVDPARIVADY